MTFSIYPLAFEENPFHSLQESVRFESLAAGREGAVLVKRDAQKRTPIVRTTSRYALAPQAFGQEPLRLAERIKKAASLSDDFNNVLIEKYDNAYSKMGAHSDQALDLAPASSIAIFSCYKNPWLAPRTLVIKAKGSDEKFERELLHGSVIVFSLQTNRRFAHKIILRRKKGAKLDEEASNTWLGLTFRTSNTFIERWKKRAYFEDGRPLRLANDEDAKSFYRLRAKENRETSFVYPELDFTLSESDLL